MGDRDKHGDTDPVEVDFRMKALRLHRSDQISIRTADTRNSVLSVYPYTGILAAAC